MQVLADHLAGWLAIPLIFGVPLCWSRIRHDGRLLVVIWAVLGLQQVLALVNTFITPLKGAETDAVKFLRDGALWAEGGRWTLEIGTQFYIELIGVVYRYIQPSKLLVCELSILASAGFLITLVFLLEHLELTRWTVTLTLLAGLWPSRLVTSSGTLREPFQLLFFSLAVTSALYARRSGQFRWWVACLASCLGLGMFHHGLALFILFLLPCLLLWPEVNSSGVKFFSSWRGILIILGVPGLIIGSWVLTQIQHLDGAETLRALWSGGALDYLYAYRNKLITMNPGAADYGLPLDIHSRAALIVSFGKIFLYYLFSPMPTMVSQPQHWIAFGEMLLRTVLLLCGVAGIILNWGRRGTSTLVLLLVLYLAMTYLWALGTTNFGTAVRHHVVSNWLLVPLAGAFFNTYRFVKGPQTLGRKQPWPR